jgi:apolipoprotein N-acyltransferase
MGAVCLAAMQWPMAHFPAIFAAMMLVASVLLVARARQPWLASIAFGLGCVPILAWIHAFLWKTTAPGFVPLMLYLAAFPTLFVWIGARLRRAWPRWPLVATLPLLFVGLEVLRGEMLLSGYNWLTLGHAMTRNSGVTWLAPLIGQYGVSFLLLLTFCLALDLARRTPDPARRSTNIALAGFMTLIVGSLISLAPFSTTPPDRTLRVGILQTNLPQSNKLAWVLDERIREHQNWLGLNASMAPAKPDVILWPETMFAGEALNTEAVEAQRVTGLGYILPDSRERFTLTYFADTLLDQHRQLAIPMLIGAGAADNLRYTETPSGVSRAADARFNSVILLRDGRIQPLRYDKIDLMPFGEFIPIAWRWPSVQNTLLGVGAGGMAFDLAQGRSSTIFTLPTSTGPVRTAAPICFEICYDRSIRRLLVGPDGRRADLIINVSNDGWFYDSRLGRGLFMLAARWRAAEWATPVVRAANTGISCVIDQHGRVLTRTLTDGRDAAFTEGTLVADAPINVGPLTLYAAIGRPLIWTLAAGATFLIALGLLAPRRLPAAT